MSRILNLQEEVKRNLDKATFLDLLLKWCWKPFTLILDSTLIFIMGIYVN